MRYKAAVFDMDGTVLNTLDDLWESVNEFLETRGYPRRSRMEVRAFLGNGATRLIQLSLPGPVSEEELDRDVAEYKKIYEKNLSRHTRPYEGIPELFRAMRDAGIQAAIVSNKPDPAVRTLAEEMLPGLATTAVGARPGIPIKPDPSTVLGILEELGVRPEEALYVGDSEVDVRTARNAGMDSAAVLWGYRDPDVLEAEHPKHLAHSPAELAGILGVTMGDNPGRRTMSAYYVIGIRVDHRTSNAVRLQELLTKHGCNIRLRVGMHEASESECADDGIIMLQATGDEATIKAMLADFDSLEGVRAKVLDLN